MNKELIKDKYHDAGFRPRNTDKRKRKVLLSSEAAFEKIHHKLGWPKLVTKLERERDEARDLAYKLYWVAWDLKRFARAYASGYKEADDEEGVAKAEEEFYETCRDIARILGMENPET